jgi:hypothetical protein
VSTAAYNYYLTEANSALNQLNSAQTGVATLTTTAVALERVALANVFSEIDSLLAGEPTLADKKITGSATPVLQVMDTAGLEEYRIFLPSRTALRNDYYTYLSGSGYNPSSAVEANAYLSTIQSILPTQTNETLNFSVIEALAEEVEKQVPALLDALRILAPPVREWILQLAWEAGDGDDRARQLLGYVLTSFLMSVEIDDYSPPGQTLTGQRILLRTPPSSLDTDAANSLLDEINGNTDTTGLTNCFVPLTPEEIDGNKAALDTAVRFLPSLHSPEGISEAEAEVAANATDPDILAEVAAELTPKGTPDDPVLLAIKEAAQYVMDVYGGPDPTALLLAVESAANDFLEMSEANFGPKASPNFRTAVVVTADPRLTGVRRREGLVALREGLVPVAAGTLYAEVENLLWIAANRLIDANAYTWTVLDKYAVNMPDTYWILKSYVDEAFTTASDLAEAETAALAILTNDLDNPGTSLTADDPATFTDALNRIATVAVTPEDRFTQFERIRDLGQRLSNTSPLPDFRIYVDLLVGGGYLADAEYVANYQVLYDEAVRLGLGTPESVSAELSAFGNAAFNPFFLNEILTELQRVTGDFFSEMDLEAITSGPSPIGTGGKALDAYWTSVVDPVAATALANAIVLSRTLNTVTDPAARASIIATDTAALGALTDLADVANVLAIYRALTAYAKTPKTVAEETAFVTSIISGNPDLTSAYEAVLSAVAAAAPTAAEVGFYPLILFSKINEYQAGLVTSASNLSVQGGRVLSNIGNTIIYQKGSSPNPYFKSYYPTGHCDVVSQAIYDPADYTYSGEQPLNGFSTARLSSSDGVLGYYPDVSSPSTQADFASDFNSSGGGFNTDALQNAICKMDTLFNLITQLNGVTDAATGAVIGGINNAIGAINSQIYGLVGKLTTLISGLGNMGSINLGVNCTCMSFDFSINLNKLLAPINSWLTNFGASLAIKNPFAGLKNPFHLDPKLGCLSKLLSPSDVLNAAKTPNASSSSPRFYLRSI